MTHQRRSVAASNSRKAGFTMAELMIVTAVIGVAISLAVPVSTTQLSKQRVRDSSRSIAKALSYARGEAIQTGNIHLVFFATDAAGDALVDANGDPVDVLVVNDGRPGAGLQNCDFDAGEDTIAISLESGVSFGASSATAKLTSDQGPSDMDNGRTFRDAGGNAASWVMFRPQGTAVAFSSDCSTGAIGSGGGGVYLTDGLVDSGIVVSPLGSNRVHSWGQEWTN